MMILNELSDLFFPRLCILCKSLLIEKEGQICLECLSELPYINSLTLRHNHPAAVLFAGQKNIVNVAAFLRYEKGGDVQKLIFSLKYRGNTELACQLGRQAALALQKRTEAPDGRVADLIIPVPLHTAKRRERGYNQSELISRGIASALNLPIYTTALVRCTATRTQTDKNSSERRLNMQKAFEFPDTRILPSGSRVLLVDDVITSGATLTACARALSSAPGIRITILALAAAGYNAT
ncbi:MAG: ComF family protein [Tannerellaceae bacterium]|jgi:ComF family protein|nr:ComF family protein [Tannerellaceae bacterium]